MSASHEDQAMLYAGLHLASMLGELVSTAVSNNIVRRVASGLLRTRLSYVLERDAVEEVLTHHNGSALLSLAY